jgi:type VI secretion system secreted protein VgrG
VNVPLSLGVLSYRFHSAAFAGRELRVVSAHVAEALNEPYTAELLVELEDADADVTQMIGRDGTFFIERLPLIRRVNGVVREVHEGEIGRNAVRVRVVLGPALWMLGKRRNTRMFQKMTVPEILKDVLGKGLRAYGRAISMDLSASYPRREYCLQYQETDLAFVSRLMEEEGISYTFDHDGETETIVLRDRNGAFPIVETPSAPRIEYEPSNFRVQTHEPIQRFAVEQRSTTTSVTLRDWDWTRGGDMTIERAAEGEDALGFDRESYEHGLSRTLSITEYSEGVRRYQAEDSARQATIRQQGHTMRGRVGRGVGRVIGLAPGVRFELTGHGALGTDGEYLVTRVAHQTRSAESALGTPRQGGPNETYHNTFECIPIDSEYRPEHRTRKPRIASVQTAVVTGPAGEEIHVDEHGRIKVQFHWDRENPANETSSCWIRVKQSWSGGAWGFWWVPRIGMEVVVQFVDGDPDRPLVTGAVYNGTNALPYAQPAEKTKSTIKSNSSPGGGGFNEFRFEDLAGSEEIFTHAQKDYNEVVENDHNTLVHNNQTNTVDVDQTQTVHANQTETVHANQSMTVDGNRTVHVKSNFNETVDATETRHVVGNVTETFDANEVRSIAANLTEDVAGNVTRTVGAAQVQAIAAARSTKIGAAVSETITGLLSQTVGGPISTMTPATHTMIAGGPFTFTTPGVIKMTAPGGIKVAAPGGYLQVDEGFTWFGGFWNSRTGIAISIWGGKTSITGAALNLGGLKAGLTKICLEAGGVEVWAQAVQSEAGAVDNSAGVEIDGHVPAFRG